MEIESPTVDKEDKAYICSTPAHKPLFLSSPPFAPFLPKFYFSTSYPQTLFFFFFFGNHLGLIWGGVQATCRSFYIHPHPVPVPVLNNDSSGSSWSLLGCCVIVCTPVVLLPTDLHCLVSQVFKPLRSELCSAIYRCTVAFADWNFRGGWVGAPRCFGLVTNLDQTHNSGGVEEVTWLVTWKPGAV